MKDSQLASTSSSASMFIATEPGKASSKSTDNNSQTEQHDDNPTSQKPCLTQSLPVAEHGTVEPASQPAEQCLDKCASDQAYSQPEEPVHQSEDKSLSASQDLRINKLLSDAADHDWMKEFVEVPPLRRGKCHESSPTSKSTEPCVAAQGKKPGKAGKRECFWISLQQPFCRSMKTVRTVRTIMSY